MSKLNPKRKLTKNNFKNNQPIYALVESGEIYHEYTCWYDLRIIKLKWNTAENSIDHREGINILEWQTPQFFKDGVYYRYEGSEHCARILTFYDDIKGDQHCTINKEKYYHPTY